MIRISILAMIAAGAWLNMCSTSSSNPQEPSERVDYQELLVGSWVGHDDFGQMNVLFGTDGWAEIDYSPAGGKRFRLPYSFKDERTIEISLYPENLIIERVNNNEILFRPEGNRVRVDIDRIYTCRFTRLEK